MNAEEQAIKVVYDVACQGNQEAKNFLTLFHNYCHEIDDFIDKKERSADKFLAILANANIVYSTPFYAKHAHRLHLVVALITNAFADSLEWAEQDEQWKRQWADSLRFAGNEMVLAVAMICGGVKLMREISIDLREIAWGCHHAADGTPE